MSHCPVINELVNNYPVVMRAWDTPVYIPNTMVKPGTADGTILETVWESRWLPGFDKNDSQYLPYKYCKSFLIYPIYKYLDNFIQTIKIKYPSKIN